MEAGAVAPRVVVRPPNLPAPPPISLLTQLNEDTGDATVRDDGQRGRWDGGAGTTWTEPIAQFATDETWQHWPGSGTSDASKVETPVRRGSGDNAPVQLPITVVLEVLEGTLHEFAGRDTPQDAAMRAALDAVAPRVIEHELWTAARAVAAGWTEQFRLKTAGIVTVPVTAAQPVKRALALAEQLASEFGFRDALGSTPFLHMSPYLFSLMVGPAELDVSPNGRQVRTRLGSHLVPEGGATATWTDAEAATPLLDTRGAAAVGDNRDDGWLFVTPPVRIRWSDTTPAVLRSEFNVPMNDRLLLAERSFVIECSIVEGHPTSIAIPVDYTQE